MMNRRALSAYGAQSLDADINTASPHRLIVLLFDGAIRTVSQASLYLAQGNVAEKGASISKAISIVEDGLRLSLDHQAGGELAANLDALYEYIAHLLLEANIANDQGKLDQALQLLKELKESWESIAPQAGSADAEPVAQAVHHGRV